jgi:hypothetical protein
MRTGLTSNFRPRTFKWVHINFALGVVSYDPSVIVLDALVEVLRGLEVGHLGHVEAVVEVVHLGFWRELADRPDLLLRCLPPWVLKNILIFYFAH